MTPCPPPRPEEVSPNLLAWLSPAFPTGGVRLFAWPGMGGGLPATCAMRTRYCRRGSRTCCAHGSPGGPMRSYFVMPMQVARMWPNWPVAAQASSRERLIESAGQGAARSAGLRQHGRPRIGSGPAVYAGRSRHGWPAQYGIDRDWRLSPLPSCRPSPPTLISAAVRLVPLGQSDRARACLPPCSRWWCSVAAETSDMTGLDEIGGCMHSAPTWPPCAMKRNTRGCSAHDFVANGPLRVGIGGPVGTGKTALMDALCKAASANRYELAAITNDIYTKEDAEFLTRAGSPRRRSASWGSRPAAARIPRSARTPASIWPALPT